MLAEKRFVRWPVVLSVVLGAVLLARVPAGAAGPDADALAVQAAALMRDGKVADAVALLQKAVQADPARRDLQLILLRARKAIGTLTAEDAHQLVLAEQEASERIEAQLALIRMGLLQVQSAQIEGNHALALKRLDAVRTAIAAVAPDAEVGVYARKADDLAAVSRGKAAPALSEAGPPPAEGQPVLTPAAPEAAEPAAPKISDEQVALALRRVREGNVNTDSPAFDPTVTADQLRARALANQRGDHYHVSSEIIDSRLIYAEDEQRFHYERDLHELVQQEVLEALMRTKADMIIPRTDLSIPRDWARRVAGRKNDEQWEILSDQEKAEIGRLDRRGEVNFSNAKLADVLANLRDTYKVNIVVDAAALRAAGIDPNQVVVDLHLRDTSLRSILTWITRPAGLGWSLEDNIYIITLPSKAKEDRYDVVYNISDIALPPRPWRPITTEEDWMLKEDRRALREHSQIFRGDARDLAAGLPLLSYFGGPYMYSYGPDPGEAARLMALVNAILSR